jgi:hypothetical protein
MAAKETSKNNKKPVVGWRCKSCGANNSTESQVCGGTLHTRLLSPKERGAGMRANMTHTPCREHK